MFQASVVQIVGGDNILTCNVAPSVCVCQKGGIQGLRVIHINTSRTCHHFLSMLAVNCNVGFDHTGNQIDQYFVMIWLPSI